MKQKKIIILLMILISFSLLTLAQYNFYYGKNKVIKKKFDWQILQTKNFSLHFYSKDFTLIKRIAKTAEEAYGVISKYLGIKKEDRIPIIFYRNHIEFEQTNLANISLGIEGFAESLAHRVVLHGDRSFEEIRRTLIHEIGHIFEYLILYKNVKSGSFYVRRPPMWIIEGFCEFVTQNWNSFYEMMVRDLVINDAIPTLNQNVDVSGVRIGRRTAWYDMGHLLFDYIYEKYGEIGVRRLFQSLQGGKFFGTYRQFFKLFNTTRKVFNYEFKQYAKNRYKDFMDRENPQDYSLKIGPDLPYIVTYSHEISPSGELLAVLTINIKNGEYDVILISAKDGKIIKNITPGLSFKHFDQIYAAKLFNPVTGNKIAWDRDAEHIAFFARKDIRNFLIIINVVTNEIVEKIEMDEINEPSSINYHPITNNIYFTALENSRSYIYKLDMKSEKISKISQGKSFIRSFTISPDGKIIIASVRTGNYYKLFLSDITAPEDGKQLTSGDYNDITPRFSVDGKEVFYSSDELGAYNIYSIHLNKRVRKRFSNVKTGNFFPVQIPKETDKIIISSFYKQIFSLYQKDLTKILEKETITFSDSIITAKKEQSLSSNKDPNLIIPKIKEQSDFTLNLNILSEDQELLQKSSYKIKDYKPMNKLVIRALPNIGVGYSSLGTFAGSSYINITDLMQDHIFTVYASSDYFYNSYYVSYLNQKNRLQHYATASFYSYAFWAPIQEGNILTFERVLASRQYGVDFGFYLPLSRYYRAQLGFGFKNLESNYAEIFNTTPLPYAQYSSGWSAPITLSFTGETTVFSVFGPLMGYTFNLSYLNYLDLGSKFITGYTLQADLRKYFRITNQMLFAFRLWGFYSDGDNPSIYLSGGNNTIRATTFYSMFGTRGFFFNAEFRFPIISSAPSIIGNIGPIRGVLFFDTGSLWEENTQFRFLQEGKFRLQDGLASYGIGLQAFIFGIPIHLEWVTKTDFSARKYYGINFWIGYDF